MILLFHKYIWDPNYVLYTKEESLNQGLISNIKKFKGHLGGSVE